MASMVLKSLLLVRIVTRSSAGLSCSCEKIIGCASKMKVQIGSFVSLVRWLLSLLVSWLGFLQEAMFPLYSRGSNGHCYMHG